MNPAKLRRSWDVAELHEVIGACRGSERCGKARQNHRADRRTKSPNNSPVQRDKKLDVAGTSSDQKSPEPKGSAGESASNPHLSVVCPFPAPPVKQRKDRGRYRTLGSKYISVLPVTNIIEAGQICKIDRPPTGGPSHNSLVRHRRF